MDDPAEIEIKLAASPAQLLALASDPSMAAAETAEVLVSTYYDTSDGQLAGKGASLRIRDSGGRREQTLKLPVMGRGRAVRNEWTVPLSAGPLNLGAFPYRARAALKSALQGSPIHSIAVVRTERRTRRLRRSRAHIEVVFDQVVIEAGERRESFAELEMELVEGRLADLIDFALELPLGPELGWSTRSKGERATALAFGRDLLMSESRPVVFPTDADAVQGFRTIGWSCIDDLLSSYPRVVADADPEAVHQCRVAMRRLRAALTIFRKVLGDPRVAVLKAELKGAASALGPARERFVLAGQVEAASERYADDCSALLAHLATSRAEADEAARTLLAGPSFQRMLFGLARLIEDAPGSERSLSEFAAATLARRRHKLRRNLKLTKMSDDGLHRLRIEVKKLRYAAQFFDSAFTQPEKAKAKRSFLTNLTRLQDALGEIHDLAVASASHSRLLTGVDAIAAAGFDAQLDELLAAGADRRPALVKTAERALKRVAESPAWWQPG